MIYVNGTEMKTTADLYINGTTPTSVYCNGTLIWAKLVSTTFSFASTDGNISATLTYYQQPGASTQTVSTSSGVSFDARSNTSVSVSMTTTGCFYPNSYSSVSPSTWKNTSESWFGKLTSQTNPVFTTTMTAGNSLSEYAVLYRCRPYISDYTSGSATSFYLFAGTTSTYAQIPIGSSNSTNWLSCSEGNHTGSACVIGSADTIKNYYWEWIFQDSSTERSQYYWFCSSVSSNNAAPTLMTMNNLKYCATTLTSGGKTRLGKIYKHAIEYLTLKNKSGSTYTITNNMPFSVTVEYNTKKCNWNDGYNWTGLSDISSFTLSANSSRDVTIGSNWFADAETCSIKAPNGYRYISCLGSDGYLSKQVKSY